MRCNDFHLTAIGHSYGSTTTAHALTDHDVDVDDAVLVASPGAGGGVEHADELDVNNDVWVGANSRDPVAAMADNGWAGGRLAGGAGLGNDPAEDDSQDPEADRTPTSPDTNGDGEVDTKDD